MISLQSTFDWIVRTAAESIDGRVYKNSWVLQPAFDTYSGNNGLTCNVSNDKLRWLCVFLLLLRSVLGFFTTFTYGRQAGKQLRLLPLHSYKLVECPSSMSMSVARSWLILSSWVCLPPQPLADYIYHTYLVGLDGQGGEVFGKYVWPTVHPDVHRFLWYMGLLDSPSIWVRLSWV